MRKPNLQSVVMLVLAIAIAAAPRPALAKQISLEEATAFALAYNPDLAAVSRELNIARGETVRAGYASQFNPQIFTQYDYRVRWGRSNSNDWRIELSQELEVFGQKALRRQAAGYNYARTQQEVADRSRLLTAAVQLTFFEALRAREQTRLLERFEQLDRSLNQAAKARLSAGKISQIEANLAQVRYGQSRAELVQGHDQYRIQCSSLGRLTGQSFGPAPEPGGDFSEPPPPMALDQLLETARTNRPDLRARQLEIARLKSEYALNEKLALPNPTLGGFFSKESSTNELIGATLRFSPPVFNRREAEATALKGQELQADEQLRATELDIERDVRDAYSHYVTAREALEIYRDEVVAPARENSTLLDSAFVEGKIDLLRLSVAVRQAFEAQMTYYDAWFGALEARVAMGLATGTLQ